MFSSVRIWVEQKRLRANLLAFLDEVEKNLERFYVIDQRQFVVEGFSSDAWGHVRDADVIKKHASIHQYALAIDEFNRLFKEHKAYEQWYASDMKNKNQENAKKLHSMKQDLDRCLKGMDGIIILAGQDLEREMLTLGILKNA